MHLNQTDHCFEIKTAKSTFWKCPKALKRKLASKTNYGQPPFTGSQGPSNQPSQIDPYRHKVGGVALSFSLGGSERRQGPATAAGQRPGIQASEQASFFRLLLRKGALMMNLPKACTSV